MSPKKYTFESFHSIQRELPEEKPVHGEYHQRAEQESPRCEEDPITESFYRKIRQGKANDSRYTEDGYIDAPQLHRMKSRFTRQVFRRKEKKLDIPVQIRKDGTDHEAIQSPQESEYNPSYELDGPLDAGRRSRFLVFSCRNDKHAEGVFDIVRVAIHRHQEGKDRVQVADIAPLRIESDEGQVDKEHGTVNDSDRDVVKKFKFTKRFVKSRFFLTRDQVAKSGGKPCHEDTKE